MQSIAQTTLVFFAATWPLCNCGMVQANDAQAIADLFSVLDRNSDGQVTATELTDAQQPYFRRALRVADRNEDGALTQAELTEALTNPQPVSMPSSTPAGRGDFDISRLDRNGDGKLTRDEIPTPLKERFERLFNQFGEPVPIQAIQAMRRMPSSGSAGNTERKPSDAINADSDAEMPKTPPRRRPSEPRPATPASSGASFFERLDKNNDGKLTRDELPPRMQQAAQRMDVNNDKSIDREEFERALRLRVQNGN